MTDKLIALLKIVNTKGSFYPSLEKQSTHVSGKHRVETKAPHFPGSVTDLFSHFL